MYVPQLVPHHIILLAPGVAAVEGEAVVVALSCHRLPYASHVLCLAHVFVSRLRVALDARHLRESGYTHYGFDGEIGVVSPVSGEVVGAELVLRVLSVLHKIVCPELYDIPVFVHICRAVLELAYHRGKSDHVARLLQRHVSAVDLSVGDGICAEIVRRERLCPASGVTVLEYTCHHAFKQFGVVKQEEGSRRIGKVDGVDASVGVVLLGEEEQVAVFVLEKLVRRDDMTV